MNRGILVCGAAALCLALSASGASAQRQRVETTYWTGTVTVEYDGSGTVDNGNCTGCTATSSDHASVLSTFGSSSRTVGVVSLKETNMYNSQCTGTVTRTELDHGSVREKLRQQNFALTATRTGSTPLTTRWTYESSISAPGIPYKGAITEEQTSVVNGVKVCTTAARPSAGVFYIPATSADVHGTTTKDLGKLSRLSGHTSASVTSCGYPRTKCTVTVRWSFHRATQSVGEKPGKKP
jgi:hypothetical protein